MKGKLAARLLAWVGYPLYFLVAFVLCAYWTFPYDRLRDFVVQEVERPRDLAGRREPSGVRLAIDELGPSWLTGAHLEGVRFVRLPQTPEGKTIHVNLDALDVRISLFGLLTGKRHVSFDATIGDGEIEGDLTSSDEGSDLELDVSSLDLRRLTVLTDLAGIPVGGTLTGHVKLTLPTDVSTSTGEVKLEAEHFAIGDGHAKLTLPGFPGDGLSIGHVDAGTLHLDATCDRGLLHIDRAEARGRDAEIKVTGNLRFATPLAMSRLDIMLRVKFTEAYRTHDEHSRNLFAAMDMFPQLAPAKTPDGGLQYQLAGPLALGVRPTPAGAMPMR